MRKDGRETRHSVFMEARREFPATEKNGLGRNSNPE